MNKKWLYGLLSAAVVLLEFYFSSQNGLISEAQSGFFTRIFLAVIPIDPSLAGFIVRKTAHFAIYFLLGCFQFLYWHEGWNKKICISFLFAFLATAAMAGLDEWHQTFVDARAGQLQDVLIDSAGGMTGIILTLVSSSLREKLKHNKYKMS